MSEKKKKKGCPMLLRLRTHPLGPWLVLFVVLNVGDAVTTLLAIHLGGHEANVFLVLLPLGWPAVLVGKLAFVAVVCGTLLWDYARRLPHVFYETIAWCLLMTAIVAWNCALLLDHLGLLPH
jgi:hypothetical protein